MKHLMKIVPILVKDKMGPSISIYKKFEVLIKNSDCCTTLLFNIALE